MKIHIQVRILELVAPSRHWAWKSAFEFGIIENVETILKMCYNSLLDPYSNPHYASAFAKIGVIGSDEWEEYLFRVFKRLIEDNLIEDFSENDIGLRIFNDASIGIRYFDVEEVAFKEAA